jgi:glycosyltransferase involved in cell wall biosynthesis
MVPVLSVIIITCNRCEKLLNCISCLEQQTLKEFEVIVVVDGSTDQTAAKLGAYAGPLRLRFVDKANEGRSVSRNLGAGKAQSDTLVFFDDDMRPFPECLQAHYQVVNSGRRTISVGTQEEDQSAMKTDFDFFRLSITQSWERGLVTATHRDVYLTAANLCIDRGLFFELHGFDQRAEVIEDFDLGLRATEFGVSVRHNRQARAWHDNPLDCQTYIRKQIEYYRSYIYVLHLRKDVFQRHATFTLYTPPPLKRVVYYLISRSWLVRWVDAGVFRYLLPRGARFRFYDVLITGLSKVYPQRFNLQAVRYHAS